MTWLASSFMKQDVHTCNRYVTVVFAFLNHLEDFFWTGHETFGGPLDIHAVILVLVNSKVHFGSVQEITNLIKVDFEVGNLKFKGYKTGVNIDPLGQSTVSPVANINFA